MISPAALIQTKDDRCCEREPGIHSPRTEPVGACPLCGKFESKFAFSATDRFCGIPGEFSYRRCASCRTVFQDPKVIREDLALCYPESYYTHETETAGDSDASGRFRSARNLLRAAIKDSVQRKPAPLLRGLIGRVFSLSSRLRLRAFNGLVDELIPRWPFGLRALEIGCGSGQLMSRLQSAGWDVEGVEWDPVAAEAARTRSGCRVWQGDFLETDLPACEYDLIVMSHVFEHLENPIRALLRIRELLAPGGRAVLFYPNPRSAGARAFGENWIHWDPPRHLVLPALLDLAKAADRAGLKPVKWRTRTGASVSYYGQASSAGGPSSPAAECKTSRALAAFARLLTALGFEVGEEAIIVVQRGHDRESR